MALGSGPFGLTTFGTTAIAVADQDITSLTSSRSILVNGQYELDPDGGFVGMDDTRRRVFLLVSYAAGKLPKYISAQTLAEIEGRTRKALAILTKQPNPEIRIKAVTATAVGGTVEILVDYVNLRTGTRQTASKTL